MTMRRNPRWLKAIVVVALISLGGCAGVPARAAVGHSHGPTGTVIGGIEPCVGASLLPVHFVAGTVVALRGTQTTQEIAGSSGMSGDPSCRL